MTRHFLLRSKAKEGLKIRVTPTGIGFDRGARLHMLFAMSNLWMVRKVIL